MFPQKDLSQENSRKIVLTLEEAIKNKEKLLDYVMQYDWIVIKDKNGNQVLINTNYIIKVDIGEDPPPIVIWTVRDTIEIDKDGWS